MGFRENSREIKMYGEFEVSPVVTKPIDPRYPEAVRPVSKANLDWTKFN
jgi:hypothetical protein